MMRARALSALGAAALATAAARQGREARPTCDAAPGSPGGGGKDSAPSSVELHCSPISPTCARYKAFFAWHRVQTKAVDTLPLSDGVSSVAADGAEVADIKGLVARVRDASGAGCRASHWAAEEEAHWVEWADEKLVPHVMVNMFRSPEEATQAMDVAVQRGGFNFATAVFLRQLGSYYMYVGAQRSKRKLEVCLCAGEGESIRRHLLQVRETAMRVH